MELTKISNNQIKDLKSLHLKKMRDREGLFVVEGKKSIIDLLDTFKIKYLICGEDWLNQNPDFKKYSLNCLLDSNHKALSQITNFSTPPDVIAIFEIPERSNKDPEIDKDSLYLLLDNIQDPGNMGTILRTCDWFGVYKIFASKETVDIFNPKVVQASMGSLSRVKVEYTDLENLINKNPSVNVFGALLKGEPFADVTTGEAGFLIVGNEGNGISENLIKLINKPVTIPPVNLKNHPDSLNVAIATAILLSQFRR